MMKSTSGTVGRSCGSVGNPMAVLCAGTSVPLANCGHWLAGGSMPRITQFRKCMRNAFTVSRCGTGLAGSSALP